MREERIVLEHRIDGPVVGTERGDVAAVEADTAAGKFREDLLYRLNTIEIRLPPLRDRREDIPLLATTFLRHHATRYRKPITGFTGPAMQTLLGYPWPGNVRELDHTIERAVLLADQTEIHPADLSLLPPPDGAARLEAMTLDEVERLLVEKALARAGGNVADAAKSLGLSRSALYRRLERFGM